MNGESRKKNAVDLLHQAYHEQMSGNLEDAIRLYQASLACYPTAEAHTFLGWSYSFQGRYDEAIAECKKAIGIDPEFGNPYNDIGSYLIHEGQFDAAIPWLEQAIDAPRYEVRHYPHCNLGRIYRAKGLLKKAMAEFEKALGIEPSYPYALQELAELRSLLN